MLLPPLILRCFRLEHIKRYFAFCIGDMEWFKFNETN